MTEDLNKNHYPITTTMNQTISDITPDKISTMRSEFKDGDIVMVDWVGPLPVIRCDFCCVQDDTTIYRGLSTGFIYDRPDFREVIIEPHMVVSQPGIEDFEYGDFGEVVIPYSSINRIMPLLSTSNVIGPSLQKQTTVKAD
jgi:hypothetical protein